LTLDPLKIYRSGIVLFLIVLFIEYASSPHPPPPKKVTFFHSKLLLIDSARMKDFCQKWKVTLIFEAPIGCQEPGLLSVWKSRV